MAGQQKFFQTGFGLYIEFLPTNFDHRIFSNIFFGFRILVSKIYPLSWKFKAGKNVELASDSYSSAFTLTFSSLKKPDFTSFNP